jgi:hypothetical protein
LFYIQAWSTYFHQGFTLTEDLQDFIQNLNEEVNVMTTDATKMEKQLSEHHKLVDRFVILKKIFIKKISNVNRNEYKFLSLLFLKSKP